MPGDFEKLHVVVTGAGGALGGAVTRRLLEAGAICHLPVRGSASTVGPGLEGARVVAEVDLADEGQVGAFYAGLPGLWASIHCAGGFAMAPLLETSSSELLRQWRINLLTAFLCCREAVRVLRRAGNGGRLVNVTARPALEPRSGAGMLAYTSSKAALGAMTLALAEELAPEGIWANAVAPAILDTPANRGAMPAADPSGWTSVDDAAATIAFLASPQNAATRGGIVPLYGKS